MIRSIYTFASLAGYAFATYTIADDYATNSFADKFNFFTNDDPTHGYVNYVDGNTAQSSGLYSVNNNQVYIGVDTTNTASGRGRNSVRIESKASYQHGLIILDLEHMPGGQCGTWPAFWLLSTSATWPNGGEVDIIENVNSANYNSMAVHTTPGCSITNTGGMSGTISAYNCDVNAPNQANNQGCAVRTSRTDSYGTGFNAGGGGVYATLWTSDGIEIYFFPRSAIPSDISSGNPDPTGWGLPMSKFTGDCDWDEKVVNQQIIFDITFCGDWSAGVWGSDPTCSAKSNSCTDYVQNNPSAFKDTYWLINSLKVYQENGRSGPAPTSSAQGTSTAVVPTPTVPYNGASTTFYTATSAAPVGVIPTSINAPNNAPQQQGSWPSWGGANTQPWSAQWTGNASPQQAPFGGNNNWQGNNNDWSGGNRGGNNGGNRQWRA